MEPTAQPVELTTIQEIVVVLRDVGIIGLLILFVVGLFRGWWTLKAKVLNGVPAPGDRELNKVVLSFPQARRRLRRRRR